VKPIRARITVRTRAGKVVATVSDGTEVSVHREGEAATAGEPTPPGDDPVANSGVEGTSAGGDVDLVHEPGPGLPVR
jgi:hypothetical protein